MHSHVPKALEEIGSKFDFKRLKENAHPNGEKIRHTLHKILCSHYFYLTTLI